jgi:hypothetical protein
LVFVAPVNGRPLAAVAATIAAAPQAFLTVAVGWHRPSDVLAAVVMALGWITIAVVASVLGGEYLPVPPKRMPLITFAIVLTIVAVTSSMLASLPLDAESTYSSVIRYAVLVLIASVVAWSIAIATWLVDRRDSAARRSVPRAMTTA